MATLPSSRAFLIQIAEVPMTGAGSQGRGVVSGRVEHVDSGLRSRFSSPEEMWAFITRVLEDEARRTSGEGIDE